MKENSSLDETAAEWAMRAFDPDFAEEDQLRRWCARSPRHREALRRAELAWQALGDPSVYGGYAVPPEQRGCAGRSGSRLPVWGGAIAACLIIAVGVASSFNLSRWARADLHSPTGSLVAQDLGDGSRVTLGADSAIELAFSKTERRIILLDGQALFEVHPEADDGRPFVVESEGGETRALGTRFAVTDMGETVDVVAIEHQIRIVKGRGPDASVDIAPGAAVRYGENATLSTRASSPDFATAWLEGRLVLDRVRISEAVNILARYSDRPVRYWGGQRKDRIVSGAFEAEQADRALQTLAEEFDLDLVRIPLVGIVLH